jgi:hypothetical protein
VPKRRSASAAIDITTAHRMTGITPAAKRAVTEAPVHQLQ